MIHFCPFFLNSLSWWKDWRFTILVEFTIFTECQPSFQASAVPSLRLLLILICKYRMLVKNFYTRFRYHIYEYASITFIPSLHLNPYEFDWSRLSGLYGKVPYRRSLSTQAGFQVAGVCVSFAIAIVGGIITGKTLFAHVLINISINHRTTGNPKVFGSWEWWVVPLKGLWYFGPDFGMHVYFFSSQNRF